MGVFLNRLALLSAALLAELCIDKIPHRRTDNAWSIVVACNVVLREFHGICLRQASYGPLSSRVVRKQWERLEAHDTRGGDELPRCFWLAVALLDELFRADGEAVLHAGNVDGKHVREVGFCQVEQGLDLRDACIGDPVVS